jgi:energy-coupling factor transporter ATP-binding protein EcfA2
MPFVDRVTELVDEAIAVSDRASRAELDDIRRRLDEPLRVLVTGRAKSGKSTLVNALLGRRVAPTGRTETTVVPAVYRYDDDEQAAVVLRDGRRERLRLVDGTLPRALQQPRDAVARIDVGLSVRNGILEELSLCDSPGHDTLTADVNVSTRELLGLGEQLPPPDAVVFVLTTDMLDTEVEFIRSFRRTARHASVSAATIGVLSRADELTDADDPLRAARELADEHLRRCHGALARIYPVMGLLAEAAETATLSFEDRAALGRLAELEPAHTDLLLLSADRFAKSELPGVSEEQRTRLLAALGLFGIADSVAFLRSLPPAHRDATRLQEHQRSRSGFSAVRGALLDDFALRAEAIKTRVALTRLTRLLGAGGGPTRGRLAERLDALLRDPALNDLAVAEACARVRAGELSLPVALVEDLERMAGPGCLEQRLGVRAGDTRAARKAVLAGSRRWSVFEADASIPQALVAFTMRTAYTRAFAHLEAR